MPPKRSIEEPTEEPATQGYETEAVESTRDEPVE